MDTYIVKRVACIGRTGASKSCARFFRCRSALYTSSTNGEPLSRVQGPKQPVMFREHVWADGLTLIPADRRIARNPDVPSVPILQSNSLFSVSISKRPSHFTRPTAMACWATKPISRTTRTPSLSGTICTLRTSSRPLNGRPLIFRKVPPFVGVADVNVHRLLQQPPRAPASRSRRMYRPRTRQKAARTLRNRFHNWPQNAEPSYRRVHAALQRPKPTSYHSSAALERSRCFRTRTRSKRVSSFDGSSTVSTRSICRRLQPGFRERQ